MKKCTNCGKKYDKTITNCPDCGTDLNYPKGKTLAIVALSLLGLELLLIIIGIALNIIHLFIVPIMLLPLASFIISIICIAKYPGNLLCKITFIINIVVCILTIIEIILFIIACNSVMRECGDSFNSCPSTLESCSEMGLIIWG